MPSTAAERAMQIWTAGVDAVRPRAVLGAAIARDGVSLTVGSRRFALADIGRIVVVGCGKAGAAMASETERALGSDLVESRVAGWVNVPADTIPRVEPTRKIVLHAARNSPRNVPTPEGVAGSAKILELVRSCGPTDLCLCLISGGGSALLPAPAAGITLEHKQAVTKLLAGCGATINEINAVRKHLSAVKGGRLAAEFRGKALAGLIISDVIGDPLDVIASGPTAADPSTFADAAAVLDKYGLTGKVPDQVSAVLREGVAGGRAETLKRQPENVENVVIASADTALTAAAAEARRLGCNVLNLGGCIEGETRHVATAFAGIVRSIRRTGVPVAAPACILSGGETTVTLCPEPGAGGRNQDFALAAGIALGADGLAGVVVLSGGTDGEDGPTDAAGAMMDSTVWTEAARRGLSPAAFLAANNAYRFFEPVGGLIKTGPTNTNVMDVRVILVER